MEASGCLYESAEKVPSCSKFAHNYNLTYSTQGRRAEISWWRCWICWSSWCAPHCRSPPCARCPRRAAMCGSTRSTVGSTRRRSTVGIKEGEERQKQKCAKCHGAVLTDCWAKLSQKLCFSWAISVTKPTVYRAAVYSILYQLAFVYLVIYKLGFTNGFNLFNCSPINERQSWCVSPALDQNPHIYGFCKTVIPNLSDQKYGIGTCICGGSKIKISRNDQTKCPAKWDQISIAGLQVAHRWGFSCAVKFTSLLILLDSHNWGSAQFFRTQGIPSDVTRMTSVTWLELH